jgi:demethylmenaquinone methyltransferase/2-methoxy-6-polyprenyl-1,4-benzoquinol methylase
MHAFLKPGARVIFIDNNETQIGDHKIVEADAQGNTYQMRPLKDGSMHRVLKNFPTENELFALLSVHGGRVEYSQLMNFWMVEYEVK